MNTLELEVKQLIIQSLNLEDIQPEEINVSEPLFGESEHGLQLDSIDALELGIAIKKRYNITLSGDDAQNRKYFYSIENLCKYIEQSL